MFPIELAYEKRMNRSWPDTQYQEYMGQGEGKYDKEQIPTCKEQRSRNEHKDEVTERIQILAPRDNEVLLLKKFTNIIKRLKQRGSYPPLHACGDLPVNTCH